MGKQIRNKEIMAKFIFESIRRKKDIVNLLPFWLYLDIIKKIDLLQKLGIKKYDIKIFPFEDTGTFYLEIKERGRLVYSSPFFHEKDMKRNFILLINFLYDIERNFPSELLNIITERKKVNFVDILSRIFSD